MCLIVKNNSRIYILKKDRICYKVVQWYDCKQWITPIRGVNITPGETYFSSLAIEDGGWSNRKSVDYGLHSFAKRDDAQYQCSLWGDKTHKVVRCIIPEGSRCISGVAQLSSRPKGYASNKIIYPNEF